VRGECGAVAGQGLEGEALDAASGPTAVRVSISKRPRLRRWKASVMVTAISASAGASRLRI
jgi:hypothetical protein